MFLLKSSKWLKEIIKLKVVFYEFINTWTKSKIIKKEVYIKIKSLI